MNTDNMKDRIHTLEQESKKLVMEIAASSQVLSGDDIDYLENQINAIKSNIEYLKANIRRKREIVLHG